MLLSKRSFPSSVLFWEGTSLYDGVPIAAVITGIELPSQNLFTGPMAQVYVIRQDMLPTIARTENKTAAVCGDCPFQGNQGACYVRLDPLNNLYRKYQAGGYPQIEVSKLVKRMKALGKQIRMSAYGEIVFTPFEVWQPLLSIIKGTGYTHAWRTCDQRWKSYLMASVEHPKQIAEAEALGWKCYRVRPLGEPLVPGEISCPQEYDDAIQCIQCGLCNGRSSSHISKSVTGIVWKPREVKKVYDRIEQTL